ncbi:MAG: glutamine synthetase III [Lentisphaeria bacterium]|nr:glutamine synthetase III [Lentisphaeria bacterium]
MDNVREKAISAICSRIGDGEGSSTPSVEAVAKNYASDVFNIDQMQKILAPDILLKMLKTVKNRAALDPSIADAVADAMKEWAISKGATHYTHWFQPLNGTTAEKHDAFFEPDDHDHMILKFSGKNLIVSEPDASSFPSGGLRSTFEARGYTAWDPTSPAFIRRGRNGATLCIPTAFCSYTGEALDRKTPLLRSMEAINKAVQRLMKAFKADKEGTQVSISLGAEQEYFLIDKEFYYLRPDLIQTGRTLFGAAPPKHQQLEDHYFGAIKPRVLAFMSDVERELWQLGIPAKTRHNEAAPAQFEIAPLFEDLNLAVDHNMLVMEVLKVVAEKHGFVCLLHEKPFAGVNGSGKHNNWSISYGKHNLLNPGNNPHENAIFLTTLIAIIRAIDLHADLLRVSTATAGNDHRLGACEAPPAIISIFLGEQLTDIMDQIEAGSVKSTRKSGVLKVGVETLPPLPRDATDRNRTSPFAFTGNKFEFRAPGSSQSCAEVNILLNAIVAESLEVMAELIENFDDSKNFNTQLQAMLQRILKQHKKVIFNGNGYNAEWVEEAHRRGLPELNDTILAIRKLLDPKNVELLEKTGVFSKSEIHSRCEIFEEEYKRKVRIEAELALLMARTMIQPAAIAEYTALSNAVAGNKNLPGYKAALRSMERVGKLMDTLSEQEDELEALLNEHDVTREYVDAMNRMRLTVDSLERLVADTRWPLPKYREMLFIY